MTQQDWIDYFEAVNGRSPEVSEIEAARLAGEFEATAQQAKKEETVVDIGAATNATAPVEPQVTQTANAVPVQGTVAHETASSQIPPQGQPQAQANYSQGVNGQSYQQAGQQPPLHFQQGPSNGEQQVYTMQVAVPSAFSLFWKQFWIWLKAAWQHPTVDKPTHKYNGATVYGLLVLFTTLSTTMPLIKSGYFTFSAFFNVFLAFSFVFISFILAGFAVKKLVYKEQTFTFGYSLEWFGRLLSLPLLLMTAATLFALLNVYSLSILLTFLSYFFFVGAAGYTLFHTVNHTGFDMFYKYLLASILFALILVVFFLIGGSIAGEMLIKGISNNLSDLFSPYGSSPFGY